MIKVAKSIKAHWGGVTNYFHARISNGKTEGINSIIQTIKRRARGYRNTDNFITMIYLVCGTLTFDLPQVCGITHGK
jgi:transposase